MLLAILLVGLVAGVASSVFIGVVLMGCFSIGLTRIILSVVRHQDDKADLGKMFSGFTDGHLVDNILLGILQYIFIFLWSLLFFIPGIVKSYSYAMSYYIKLDHPELGANDCITASRRMMKGHKWQLFVLDLSFIGWYIVGMLCFGIGVLWVEAYHQTARAEFYNSLAGE